MQHLEEQIISKSIKNYAFPIIGRVQHIAYGQFKKVKQDPSNEIDESLFTDDTGVIKHLIIDIDLNLFTGSALTDDIEVSKDRFESDVSEKIPVTYVPAHNTIFR